MTTCASSVLAAIESDKTVEGLRIRKPKSAVFGLWMGVWGAKTRLHLGVIRICRENRVLTPQTDDAEKLRG
jgi:hypothetical protein